MEMIYAVCSYDAGTNKHVVLGEWSPDRDYIHARMEAANEAHPTKTYPYGVLIEWGPPAAALGGSAMGYPFPYDQ
jgi:hypothetical protein